ncbi:MAG: hypothetical protein AAFY41_04665 [Bacteroidota bacterium]
MEQTINITEPKTFKLGVEDPILLDGISTSGRRVAYEVLTPDTCEINGVICLPKAVGEVQIKVTVPAYEDYEAAEKTISFTVSDGDFFERSAAIIRINDRLKADQQSLNEVAKNGLSEVKSLEMIDHGNAGSIVISGKTYPISNVRFMREYINSSIAFWENKLQAEYGRLQQLITELKAL